MSKEINRLSPTWVAMRDWSRALVEKAFALDDAGGYQLPTGRGRFDEYDRQTKLLSRHDSHQPIYIVKFSPDIPRDFQGYHTPKLRDEAEADHYRGDELGRRDSDTLGGTISYGRIGLAEEIVQVGVLVREEDVEQHAAEVENNLGSKARSVYSFTDRDMVVCERCSRESGRG